MSSSTLRVLGGLKIRKNQILDIVWHLVAYLCIKLKKSFPYSLTSDGTFLYLQSTHGLYKIGSGYGGTIKGQIYAHNKEFYAKPGWLGYASGSLFFKASTSSVDFNLIKIDDLNVEKVVVSSNETTLSRPG